MRTANMRNLVLWSVSVLLTSGVAGSPPETDNPAAGRQRGLSASNQVESVVQARRHLFLPGTVSP